VRIALIDDDVTILQHLSALISKNFPLLEVLHIKYIPIPAEKVFYQNGTRDVLI
jgi:hypothetical protein